MIRKDSGFIPMTFHQTGCRNKSQQPYIHILHDLETELVTGFQMKVSISFCLDMSQISKLDMQLEGRSLVSRYQTQTSLSLYNGKKNMLKNNSFDVMQTVFFAFTQGSLQKNCIFYDIVIIRETTYPPSLIRTQKFMTSQSVLTYPPTPQKVIKIFSIFFGYQTIF